MSEKKESKNLFRLIEKARIYFRKHEAFKKRAEELKEYQGDFDLWEKYTSCLYAASRALSEAENVLKETGKELVEALSKSLKVELSCKVYRNELWIFGDFDEVKRRFVVEEGSDLWKVRKNEKYCCFLDDIINQVFPEFKKSRIEVKSDLLIDQNEKHRIENVLVKLRSGTLETHKNQTLPEFPFELLLPETIQLKPEWQKSTAETKSKRGRKPTTSLRILKVLKEHPDGLIFAEIYEKSKVSRGALKKLLSVMKKKSVIRYMNGKYVLKEQKNISKCQKTL